MKRSGQNKGYFGSVRSVSILAAALVIMGISGYNAEGYRGEYGGYLPDDFANIRVLHLSPDAPDVDIWVNESIQAVTDLQFPQGTEYLELEAGTYTFDVVPTGQPVDQSVLTIPDLPLSAGEYYTAVAYDFLSSISPLALVDDLSMVGSDMIRVRAIHTASGVGEVDIWLLPEMGDPVPLWVDVGFGDVGEYVETSASAFVIGFDLDDDAVPDLIFDVPALPEDTVANVFAVKDDMGDVFLIAQLEDGTTVKLEPRPEPAGIRVIHLSPDAPAVDVWVNDSILAVEDLSFKEGTEYLELDAGTYSFDVSPAGTNPESSVLAIDDLPLEAGMDYTAVAYDFLSGISALALVDDNSETAHGSIRVRAIHTASGVGEVDIWLIPEMGDPAPLWENLGYGEVGEYLETAAEAFTIGFDVDDDAVPDLIYDVPALPSGTVANVFAVRDGEGDVFLIAQLPDGTTAEIGAVTCDQFGVDLTIPTNYVSPGNAFYVLADICNPGAPQMDAPFFALLDIGTGDYWFYPSWVMYPSVDYEMLDLPTGLTSVDVLPEFTWPDTDSESFSDIHIFGAILSQDLTSIVGEYDVVAFGYGPAM